VIGLSGHVVRWLETNISEAVLPPSSGLKFMVMEMYPLHCCLPREVLNLQFEVLPVENRSCRCLGCYVM